MPGTGPRRAGLDRGHRAGGRPAGAASRGGRRQGARHPATRDHQPGGGLERVHRRALPHRLPAGTDPRLLRHGRLRQGPSTAVSGRRSHAGGHAGGALAGDAPRRHRRRQDPRNLHVVREPLNEYLRYQFEWGYVRNVAWGMDIRVLDVATVPAAARLLDIGDFGVIEGGHVARLH
ncbi:MAG: DUF6879 family protein [Pseudonocardia sp.]